MVRIALLLAVALLLAACSGRTTGATNIVQQKNGRDRAQLNAVGSCDQGTSSTPCVAYMRYREVGSSTWTSLPKISIDAEVSNVPWSQRARGLFPEVSYEYQACGKEASWSQFVCVGPDGTTNTTSKFVAVERSTDWSQFHYAADHVGYNPWELGNGSFAEEWTSSLNGCGFGSPSVADGVVYGGQCDQLEAFPAQCGINGATCSPLWTGPTGGQITSAPAVEGGDVYVGSGDDKLYAFPAGGCGASTCDPLWTATTGGPIDSSPTVAGGVVYVASDKLYAFSATGCGASTCSPLWSSTVSGGSSPAVKDGVVYFGSGNLYAFAAGGCGASTCSPIWTGTANSLGQPAVAGGVVYAVGDKLYAFSAGGCGAATCSPIWTGAGGASSSAPAVAYGDVYVVTANGVAAFPAGGCGATTCSALWSAGVPSTAPGSSPAVANGYLYVGRVPFEGPPENGLEYFNVSSCSSTTCPVGFLDTNTSVITSPAVAGGELYVGSQDTRLYAFSVP